jgi:phage host-nuclease inhibitor protein Gam
MWNAEWGGEMKIKSWEDVDRVLREIAKREAAIAESKAQIDEEKAAIKDLEPEIEAYVREHEGDMQERSLSLENGKVWLRKSSHLHARSWQKVLEHLKEAKVWACIRKKFEVDKEALEGRSEEFLSGIGVRNKEEDGFGYETA